MNDFRAGRLIVALLALATASCVSVESREAVRVLNDIEARRGPSELKKITPNPRRTTIVYRVGDRESVADLYEPGQPIGAGLVLVTGRPVQRPFRGLLSVHSRYGLHTRQVTNSRHAIPKASAISSPP